MSLQIRNLYAGYGRKRVLTDVSLEVGDREIVALDAFRNHRRCAHDRTHGLDRFRLVVVHVADGFADVRRVSG